MVSGYDPRIFDKIVYIERHVSGDEGRSNLVRMRSLLTRMSSGQRLAEIRTDLPGIPTHVLIQARNLYASLHPEQYESQLSEMPFPDVWIDENLGNGEKCDAIRRGLNRRVIHIGYTGSLGVSDVQNVKDLCKKGFRFAVSSDWADISTRQSTDLTRCLIYLWIWQLQMNGGYVNDRIRRLPKLLHIDTHMAVSDIYTTLRDNRSAILEIEEECVYPTIRVTKGHVRPGGHFLDLIHKDTMPIIRELMTLHRDRIVSYFETDHLDEAMKRRMRKSIWNRVMHDISRDIAAIGYGEDREDKIVQLIKMRTEEELKIATEIAIEEALKPARPPVTDRAWYSKREARP